MWNDVIPWLIAAIGALVGALGVYSGKSSKEKVKEQKARADALSTKKKVQNEIDLLDVDSQLDEFERLHNARRR